MTPDGKITNATIRYASKKPPTIATAYGSDPRSLRANAHAASPQSRGERAVGAVALRQHAQQPAVEHRGGTDALGRRIEPEVGMLARGSVAPARRSLPARASRCCRPASRPASRLGRACAGSSRWIDDITARSEILQSPPRVGMPAERAGARARRVDEHEVHRANRRKARVGDVARTSTRSRAARRFRRRAAAARTRDRSRTPRDALRDSSTDFPPGAAHRSATSRARGHARVLRDERRRRILQVKQSLAERAELGERRHGARQHDAVAHERRVVAVNAGRLEHRLELLAHDVPRTRDERRFAGCSPRAALAFPSMPQRSTQRATSQRGCEPSSASASIGSAVAAAPSVSRSRSSRRSTAFASLLAPMPCRRFASSTVCAIAAYAGTLSMYSNCAAPRRRRSCRSASRRYGAAADARVEIGVETRAAAKHAVHELAHPAAIARVETRRSAVERRIEQVAAPNIGADVGRGDARICHPAGPMDGDTAFSTGRPMVLICPWHIN